MRRFFAELSELQARSTRRRGASSATRRARTRRRSRSSRGSAAPAASLHDSIRRRRAPSRSLDFVAPHEARLLPALRGRDGADAPLPRAFPRASRRGSRAAPTTRRRRRGRSPTTTRTRGSRSGSRGYGWLPFDPTPGRGSLSAAYSVSSPDFRIASAQRLHLGRRGVAAEHGGAAPGRLLRREGPGVIFRGTDIRPAQAGVRRAVRDPAARRQPREAARARPRARDRAARAREGGASAPPLRDARSARPGCGVPRRPARLPRRPAHPRRAERSARGGRGAPADGARGGRRAASPPRSPPRASLRCPTPSRPRRVRARSSPGCASSCADGSAIVRRARGLVSLRSLGFTG